MTTFPLLRSMACSLLFALIGFSLPGCGTTTLTDTWQSPAFQGKQMQDVLVVGVTPNKTNRILFERGFVNELANQGIHAIPSYEVIGSALPTKATVSAYLKSKNIPYVIVTNYGGKETTAEHVPASVSTYYTGGYYPYYGSYWDRYGSSTTMVREAYVSTRSKVMLMTSIYDVKTEKLVWVGRSKTFEANSITPAANELAKRIVANIK